VPARLLAAVALIALATTSHAADALRVRACTEIGTVWAGHPVGFSFAKNRDQLYVGFYDENRFMVVGQRPVGKGDWTLHRTRERVGWDSHNSIAFGFDPAGGLHVAANMHCVPLRYYRTKTPGDVTSLEALHKMTGQQEKRATYPVFMNAPDGRLYFIYRDGGSGNGMRLINVYDEKARTWARHVDKPLLSGLGKVNAYPTRIATDRKGMFHIAWVWRDTPDCSTNHDVSYARSRDLKTWETSAGDPIALPMTPGNSEVVDPVPARGGLLNNVKLSFDGQDRPMIAYHKFDADGNTQLFVARLEGKVWKIRQTTKWKHRWYFKGGGCIRTLIGFSAVTVAPDGRSLMQSYSHWEEGGANRLLDAATLQPIGKAPRGVQWPAIVRKLESDFAGMRVNVRTVEHDGATFALRWETLGANRDRPRPNDQIPPPSRLVLYELR